MEGLVDLLPLLLIAAYYLLRGRKRTKQPREKAPQTPLIESTASEPRGPTPFQQILQQIEDAVSEASGEPRDETPKPEPSKPVPSPLPAPPAEPVRPAPEFNAVRGSFDAPRPVDHVRHGFGADNPLSEESFERRPPQAPQQRARGPLPDPHGLRQSATPAAMPGTAYWRAKLRDPKAAREAFVLRTIFGSRGGRHAEKR